jgi:peptide/nickel transport system substrate-binding protein
VISRRSLLGGVASCILTPFASSLMNRGAVARGRVPYGGRIELHVPWPVASLDPHRIDDATAALFGDSLFDTLYARVDSRDVLPSLAESDPEPADSARSALRVPLRTGVRFASGTPFDARAAALSIARARARDAAGWLAEIPAPRVGNNELIFPMQDARKLSRALSSPLLAIVPPRFNPERPDGTGPLKAEMQAGALLLLRNGLAASGPAFLDAVEARHATDLVTSLRAFESGADDVGWLGSFLHEPRQGARGFDAGAVGWAILRTGRDAGSLDVRGTAQALADGIPHASLAALVVGPPWEQGTARWTGPPSELLVRDDSPWLVEVARSLAATFSSPSHEVNARPSPATEIAQRRTIRSFTLMLDVARPAGPGPLGVLIGLATADDAVTAASLTRHPPRGDVAPRTATRTMRIGVVGEIRLEGGRAPEVVLPLSPWGRGVDWGSAYRMRRGG